MDIKTKGNARVIEYQQIILKVVLVAKIHIEQQI